MQGMSPQNMGLPQGMGGMPQPGMPQPGMPQPGMNPGGYPQQMPPGAGPNKTVALQSSDGVVSIARTGQPLQPAGNGAIHQGATPLFWIMSLITLIAVRFAW